MVFRRIILLSCSWFLLYGLSAQSIEKFAIVMTDLNGGKNVLSRNAHNPMVPASITKLITTATALEVLGEDFQFQTEIQVGGDIKDSVLYGDLIVKASGDPMLGSEYTSNRESFLNEWSSVVLGYGIQRITGDIVADVSVFDKQAVPKGWLAEDLGNYYAAGVYGLSLVDNTLRVAFRTGVSGSLAKVIGWEPAIKDCHITSKVKARKAVGDAVYFSGKAYQQDRTAIGNLEANSKRFIVKADLGNPNMALLQAFRDTLSVVGVEVDGGLRVEFSTPEYKQDKPRTILKYNSVPLSDIIRLTNVHSINMYAETLLKRISMQRDECGNFPGGISFVKEFWGERGLDVSLLNMKDGSGLTPNNSFTADFLNKLLIEMYRSENRAVFMQSLPIAGQTGTVKRFLKDTSLEGKARLKSGSMRGVQCYAGYIEANGTVYSIVVMANGFRKDRKTAVNEIEREILSVINNAKR